MQPLQMNHESKPVAASPKEQRSAQIVQPQRRIPENHARRGASRRQILLHERWRALHAAG